MEFEQFRFLWVQKSGKNGERKGDVGGLSSDVDTWFDTFPARLSKAAVGGGTTHKRRPRCLSTFAASQIPTSQQGGEGGGG